MKFMLLMIRKLLLVGYRCTLDFLIVDIIYYNSETHALIENEQVDILDIFTFQWELILFYR